MSTPRTLFGAWGADLADAEFACALAACGVLRGHAPLPLLRSDRDWLLDELERARAASSYDLLAWTPVFPESPSWCSEVSVAPQMLAGAWRAFLDRGVKPRLEIAWSANENVLWAAAQFARPEVGAASVYLREDEPRVPVGWEWPLRVGFLPDPTSRALRARVSHGNPPPWLQALACLAEVGITDRPCDLLVLPFDLSEALAAVLAAPRPVQADLVVVLGGWRGSVCRGGALLGALRAAVRTSGVALIGMGPGLPLLEPWSYRLVEVLAHNEPLDVALRVATKDTLGTSVLLVAARSLVEFSRVARQRDLVTRTLRIRQTPVVLPLAGVVQRCLNLAGAVPGAVLADAIEAAEHAVGYRAEHGMAGVLAEVRRATAATMSSPKMRTLTAPPSAEPVTGVASPCAEPVTGVASPCAEPLAKIEPPPEGDSPRFLQARVTDARHRGETNSPALCAFQAGLAHDVSIRIGLPRPDTMRVAEAFPVHELPPNQETYELTVVFVAPQLLTAPQTARIFLPRTGDSTACTFTIFVRESMARVEAQVIVAFGNRVLQTALLTGDVLAAGVEAPEASRILFDLEAIVRSRLDDLGDRRRFDAAFVLNDNGQGVPGVTKLADGHATLVTQPELAREMAWFDETLTQVAYESARYKGETGRAALEELLCLLAQHGAMLRDVLVVDGLSNLDVATRERIQIISTKPEARLPVEFIYDRPAPVPGAKLCPRAADVLAGGACPSDCPAPGAWRDRVCPLGFWGISKVLERHAHDRRLAAQLPGVDFAFQSEPTETRNALDVLGGALFGVSQRVRKATHDGVERLGKAAAEATRQPPLAANTWEEWHLKVEAQAPSLLLLLVHTEPAGPADTLQKMEIGDGSWLNVANVEAGYVHRQGGVPPLVFLLGCETVGPEVPFLSLAAKFRREGAALVVCSGAKIHSDHAVAMAESFMARLKVNAATGDRGFGEVMRDVRRHLLANGIPTALTLCAFGDADWRLASGLENEDGRRVTP